MLIRPRCFDRCRDDLLAGCRSDSWDSCRDWSDARQKAWSRAFTDCLLRHSEASWSKNVLTRCRLTLESGASSACKMIEMLSKASISFSEKSFKSSSLAFPFKDRLFLSASASYSWSRKTVVKFNLQSWNKVPKPSLFFFLIVDSSSGNRGELAWDFIGVPSIAWWLTSWKSETVMLLTRANLNYFFGRFGSFSVVSLCPSCAWVILKRLTPMLVTLISWFCLVLPSQSVSWLPVLSGLSSWRMNWS